MLKVANVAQGVPKLCGDDVNDVERQHGNETAGENVHGRRQGGDASAENTVSKGTDCGNECKYWHHGTTERTGEQLSRSAEQKAMAHTGKQHHDKEKQKELDENDGEAVTLAQCQRLAAHQGTKRLVESGMAVAADADRQQNEPCQQGRRQVVLEMVEEPPDALAGEQ